MEIIEHLFATLQGEENEELLFTYRGVLYPKLVCSPGTFEALETMEARKDDKLIVAYPKCGEYPDMDKQPSPRIFSTHFHYDNIPKSFFENKMLVVFRNPKDAAVSYYHFYNKNPVLPDFSSWDDFFQKFMSGEGRLEVLTFCISETSHKVFV
uniref:Sulfotransferase n=1 Tax=Podarcis muralis TaxID=64176 RepID=A0A670HNH6_PODMU